MDRDAESEFTVGILFEDHLIRDRRHFWTGVKAIPGSGKFVPIAGRLISPAARKQQTHAKNGQNRKRLPIMIWIFGCFHFLIGQGNPRWQERIL